MNRRTAYFAGVALLVALVVIFWRELVALFAAGLGVHWLYRRAYPRRRSGKRQVPIVLEAVGIIAGAGAARKLAAAKVRTEHARADELAARAEWRRKTKDEQEKMERAAYWAGARDARP